MGEPINYTDFRTVRLQDFCGKSFDCGCGKKHVVATQKISLTEELIPEVLEEIKRLLPAGSVLVVTDENLYEKYVQPLKRALSRSYTVNCTVLPKGTEPSVRLCGKLLKSGEENRLVLSYGSGSLTDLVKYYASLAGVPHVAVGSAPSTDGYLSDYAMLYAGGVRTFFKAKAPDVLIMDMVAVRECPPALKAAGYGCMMAKLASVFECSFAQAMNGEQLCENAQRLILSAVSDVIKWGGGLVKGSAESLQYLVCSLLKCGLAVQLTGQTRLIHGSVDGVSGILERVLKKQEKSPVCEGERCLLAQMYLLPVYCAFFEQPVKELLLPPDYGRRAVLSEMYLGLSQKDYLSGVSLRSGSENPFQEIKMEEYRREFSEYCEDLKAKSEAAFVVFRRMYPDAGHWTFDYLDGAAVGIAMKLATENGEPYTVLTYLRDRGYLEEV